MLRRLSILFVCFLATLNAEDDNIPDRLFSEHLSEDSALIGGCVNVTNGMLVHSDEDIVMAGAEPFSFRRSYHLFSDEGERREEKISRALKTDWFHNHYSYLCQRMEKIGGCPHTGYSYVDPAYESAHYYTSEKVDLQAPHTLFYNPNTVSNRWITNTAIEGISGQTHPLNARLDKTTDLGRNFYELTNGSGVKKRFKNAAAKYKVYQAHEEIRPSGNCIKYDYAKEIKLVSVRLRDPSDKVEMASFSFHNINNKTTEVHASDGRKIVYHFLRRHDRDSPFENYYLERVEKPSSKNIGYNYYTATQSRAALRGWDYPNRRFVRANSYSIEEFRNCLRGLPKGGPGEGFLERTYLAQVKNLVTPAGVDSRGVPIYRFEYQFNVRGSTTGDDGYISSGKDFHEIGGGCTHVYDAYNQKTTFHFDDCQRIWQIDKYNANNTLDSKVKKFWAQGGNSKGFLKSRLFQDGEGRNLFARSFNYDARGNITVHRVFGDLSGECQVPLEYGSDGYPLQNGIEYHEKNYTYSDDGFNLVLTESSGDKIIQYQYLPGTNLMTAKFTCEGETILLREFYFYDENASPVKTISDDGCSENVDDLSGVTYRLITMMTPKSQAPCLGLPEVIEEKHLDMESVEEKLLRKTVREYSREGWVLKEEVFDANNEWRYTKRWEYDNDGNVTLYEDPLGNAVVKTYDLNDNCLSEQTAKTLKHYTYDFSDRLIKEEEVVDGKTLVTSYAYDLMSRLVKTTDIYGNQTHHIRDEFGREVRTEFPGTASEAWKVMKEYNVFGHVTEQSDSLGRKTQTSYNVRGQPVVTIFSDGTQESCLYNLDGTLKRRTEKNGIYAEYTYDFLHRPIKEEVFSTEGKQVKTTTHHYKGSLLVSTKEPDGRIKEYRYDGAGRRIGYCYGDEEAHYEYDELGRIAKESQCYGSSSREITIKAMSYDLLDRVIEERTEDSSGHVLKKTSCDYDADGNKVEETIFNEHGPCTTFTEYNARRQPTRIVDAEGNVTIYTYDYAFKNSLGQTVSQTTKTDPLGNLEVVTYDTLGNAETIEKKNPFGVTTSLLKNTYDLAGNKIKTVHTIIASEEQEREFVVDWEYDNVDRLIKLTEATGTVEQKITAYRYNNYGQKEDIVKPDGSILHHTYDALGRLQTFNGPDIHYAYTYDINDNVISVEDNSGITKRTYDRYSRLIKEVLSNGLKLAYRYDRLGRPTEVALPNWKKVKYTYDAAFLRSVSYGWYTHTYDQYDLSGQVTSMGLMGYGGQIEASWDRLQRVTAIEGLHFSEEDITYDAVGNLLSMNKDHVAHNYTYDDLYQLQSEEGTCQNQYTYDSLHNRHSKNGKQYTLNALNQVVSDSEKEYEYDFNGNMIKAGDIEYQYDCLDRLISVVKPWEKIQYSYDAFNRRVKKEIYSWSTIFKWWKLNKTHRYIYQGDKEVGMYDDEGLQELRILGHGKGAEIGATVAMKIAGRTYVPFHDHNGNIVGMMTAWSGRVAEKYEFSAFGEEEPRKYLSPWRFSSKRVDTETGFVYFGRRYYDPRLGRWVTSDPKGYDEGPNLYAYVVNNPLTHFDEYGLEWRKDEHGAYYHTYGEDGNYKPGMISRGIGRFYEFHGDHLNIVPYLRNWEGTFGRYLQGKRMTWEREGWTPPSVFSEGGEDLAPHLGLTFNNGIMNDLPKTRDSVRSISQIFDNSKVTGIHTPSYGFMHDVSCAGIELAQLKTEAVNHEYQAIMNKYNEIKNYDNGMIIHFVHSRGGATFDVVRKMLPSKVKEKMIVYTFGSAKMIPKKGFKDCWNFYSEGDPIPGVSKMLDPGVYKHRGRYNIEILPSDKFMEHSVQCDTYQNKIRDLRENFKETYGY